MNNQYSMVTRDQRAAGQKRKEATENDKFPVGMRVFILESGNSSREVALKNLLLQCQYNVTTMNHARDIVRILRENRNKFDLVVVDVAMLDTSCFKLLDLIENDFNIPLVVISGNSDHKLVKKAIELGASDYLLKPLRIEEIRNIWQHAFRRKYPHLIAKPSTSGATPQEDQTTIQALVNANNSELYRVLNENDDADGSDENEDSSSSRKKTRIVWTMDLHSKFVAVVNQLGLEKAVPKRILELMGVEDLTRENIASHLQKYRMYLRRTGGSSSEQPDTVPALGGSPSYLHLTPSERNRAWGGAKGLPYYNMPQLSPGVPFGSQLSDAPRSSSELTETSEQQPSNHVQLSGLPSSNSALQSTQPMPSNLVQSNQGSSRELINQLSDTHNIARRMKVSALIPNKKSDFVQGKNTSSNGLDLSQECTSARNLKIPGPNSSFPDVSNNLLESPRHILFMAKSGIQSNISPFKDPSNIGLGDSSLHALDNGTSNGNWKSYNQFQQFLPAPLPFTGGFSQNQPARNNLTNEFSSTSRIAGDSHQNQSSFFTNQAANMNFPRAQWDLNYNGNEHDGIGCFQSPMPTAYGDSSNQLLGVGQYGVGDFNADFTKQFNTAPESGQQCAVGNFTMEANMTANDVYVPTQPQTQDEYVPNGADSIDEILNAMVKQDQETSLYGDDDFNFNMYNF